MTASALTRRIGLMIAAAALSAAVAGSISDIKAASPNKAAVSKKPASKAQLRYYGGPKSPMWSGQ
jgi:hypothetical protein